MHLGSDNEPNFILFVNWLKKLELQNASHLFLMGDIFDLWIENHKYFKNKYKIIIEELQRLQNGGVQIFYFEGNHDLYLKSFWQEELGFLIFEQVEYIKLGPWCVRAEHGDQIDTKDWGYLLLRWFLRTQIMKWVASNLPEKWIVRIGESASKKSRHYTTEIKSISETESREKLHQHAHKAYVEKAFDWLICGHTHIKEQYSFFKNNKEIKAINLGTWLKEPVCFVLTSSGGSFQKIQN